MFVLFVVHRTLCEWSEEIMHLATHCGWSILDIMALRQLDANSASLIANRWDSLEEMMSELPGDCTVSLHNVTNLWDECERRIEPEITR